MEGWKGPGQPLKLSPVIPVVKVVDWKAGRDQGSHYSSSFIPVVTVVENGRLEGTRAATSALLHPKGNVVESGKLEGTRAATKAFFFHPSGDGCRNWKVGRDQGSH
jgi:hypothetical protein